MANQVLFYVGGTGGTGACNNYTQYVIRASYTKNFCDNNSFNIVCDGIHADNATEFGDFALDKNVFFGIDTDGDSNIEQLLFKGVIDKVSWTSKKRVKISGTTAMRASNGSAGQLTNTQTPEWSETGPTSVFNLINGATWVGKARSWKDDGSTGESEPVRPS